MARLSAAVASKESTRHDEVPSEPDGTMQSFHTKLIVF